MPSTRRDILATATLLLAGCTSIDDGGASTNPTPSTTNASRTTSSTTTATANPVVDLGGTATLGDVEARALDARGQVSYFHIVFPDLIGVTTSEGHQFVLLSVDVEAPGRYWFEPEDFSVVLGDRSYSGRSEEVWSDDGSPADHYGAERGSGLLVFEVPAPIEADGGSLALDLGDASSDPLTWRFGDDLVAALKRPADFEVRDFQAPPEVAPGDPIEVSATIANVGEGAGTFRVVLNLEGGGAHGGPPTTFELNPGEERVWEETVTAPASSDEGVTVHLRFRSAGGNVDQDVVVRPPGSTSG